MKEWRTGEELKVCEVGGRQIQKVLVANQAVIADPVQEEAVHTVHKIE